MKSIILCEGETDQIILSYYFQRMYNYHYNEEKTKKFNNSPQNGIICSYTQITLKGKKTIENELVIWAVGGRNRLPERLNYILTQNKMDADCYYERIIIMSDKDSEEESTEIWRGIKKIITEKCEKKVSFKENEWFLGKQTSSFNEIKSINFLTLNIPTDGTGSLETFLLNALKEQSQADKYVAEQAIKFVKKLIGNQYKLENKYLNKRRDCIKAPLAVYFGIISPEHIFKKMDPILKKIPWENYTTIQKGFEQFYCFLEK